MEQYISKAALVAEIEKLKHRIDDRYSYSSGWKDALLMVEAELDTLEVKEADLDKMLTEFMSKYAYENGGEYPSAIDIARHFFELRLKAQKGE